jgi:FAD/FMN-containing dehydrogenase
MTLPEADWKVLQRRLSGELVLPRAEQYEWARKPFIARFDEIRPQALAYCANVHDVGEVISFARRRRIPVAPRSGGHSLAGYSSTSGIVIDVSPLDLVAFADGVVSVGAGACTGKLAERLVEHGFAIPTGTCPSVGIAGLTLGGGIGILGRAHGLTLDRLVGAQVVLADGSVVDCSVDELQDLFWALRGAGAGNFGVVTAFAFDPLPAPTLTNFHLVWSFAAAAAVIAAWQTWSPTGPDELSADLVLAAPADAKAEAAVEVFGAMIATEDETLDVLRDLVQRAGAAPRSQDCKELSYAGTCAYQAEVSVGYDQIEETPRRERRLRQGYRITKSQFFAEPLPPHAIAALVETFGAERREGEARNVGFAPWGGAYNRPAPEATAFAHRDQLFSIEHIVIVNPTAPETAKTAARDWIRSSYDAVHAPASSAVYPCFTDPELEDPGRAYYDQNYERLIEIKQRYDPDNVFRFEQSIPLH